jgi:hypothetical protein
MKTPILLVLTTVAALALTACSSTSDRSPAVETTSTAATVQGVPGGIFISTSQLRATVTGVDKTSRKVTLRGADGKKRTIKAGPDVVNFDQIKVGDEVLAEVTEELVVYLNERGAPVSEQAEMAMILAPKGAKPSGVLAESSRVTARVESVDLAKHTATLRFEDGSTKIFPVRPDVELNQGQVGQQVVFRVTDMIAISVSKP